MKKFTSIISIILIVAMLSCVLVLVSACSGLGDGFVEVAGKTNIRVTTYDGGLGKDWLEKAAKAFEAKYKDVSFEDGKTGVAVHVDFCQGGDMMEDQTLNKDVYFTEVVDYYRYVNLGKVADITDVVTGDLADFGESGITIESKLDASYKNFLTAKDDKYYAIPFYEGYMGFIYDRDLFAEKGYFIDKNGNWTGDENRLSVGADGVADTYDDGLPETYSQFIKLVEKMSADNITPFIFGEDALAYFQKLLASLWTDYEGKDNMLKNWDFTGSFNIVTGFSGSTPIISSYTIDTENIATSIKQLQKQPGKYYALKFLENTVLAKADYYGTMPYQSAQAALIASTLGGGYSTYGMLVDGVWWENEAALNNSFSTISVDDINYSGSKDDYKSSRRFAFMPFPQEDNQAAADKAASTTHKHTLFSANDAFAFISAESTGAKLQVAKLFMQYVHTDEQMSSFTATTSVPRALNYTLTESDKANMTYFGKNIMELKNASDIVYPYSGHPYYIENSATFSLTKWGWVSGKYDNPFLGLKDGVSALSYFNGLSN